MFDEEEEQEDGEMCKCAVCEMEVLCDELEAHICSEHLDYFPYSCAFCSHFFTTDVLAHFHTKTKKHLPMKIREQPDIRKYKKLHRMMDRSLEGQQGNRQQIIERMSQTESALLPSTSTRPSCQLAGQANGGIPDVRQFDRSLEDLDDNRSLFNVHVLPKWSAQAVMGVEQLDSTILQGQVPNGDQDQLSSNQVEVKCNLCGMFIFDKDKVTHIQMHREKQLDNFACEFCNFTANSQKPVRNHVQMQHPDCRPVAKGVKKSSGAVVDEQELNQLCFAPEGLSPELAATFSTPPLKKTTPKTSKGGKGKSHLKFSKVATLPNGKSYRFMKCRQCEAEVCEAEISAHIFQVHVEWENLIKCSYCDFQHTHNYSLVKKHLLEAHPGQKVVIRDRRKGSKAHLLLKEWCKICFTGKVEKVLGKRAASTERKEHKKKKKKKKKKQKQDQALRQEEEDRPEVVFESELGPVVSDKLVCQKCSEVVPKSKVDEHVWLEHNDGELPYKCGNCQKSTITLDDMEQHWTTKHCNTQAPSTSSAVSSTMEVIPNPSSRPKFDIQMVECFPKEAGDRWAKIKIELEGDYY